MAKQYDTASFLSDYGLADEFVGVVKSVVRSIAPHAVLIDITHQLPPYDVRAGALALVRSVQYLAPGVIFAAVDPGVGTDRRAVAVEVGDGESVLVGPDNGLLASAVSMAGGSARAVELNNEEYQLPSPGPTFAGRDIFAPAVGYLCSGVELMELGTEIDPISLRPGVLPLSREEDGKVLGEVLWVDRFGNAQLNVDPDDLNEMGDRILMRWRDKQRVARKVHTFADLAPSEVGLLVDSYGMLCVSMNKAPAGHELGLGPGVGVSLEEPGE